MNPADVDMDTTIRAVRELQRMGLIERENPGWVSVDYIPLIAEHLGFRRKTVRALRAELANVRQEREKVHIGSVAVAGYQYGWVSLDAAACILRDQGLSVASGKRGD